MRVLLDLATVTAAAVGLLWGCGFLLERLVPWRFRPLLPLISPFLGFSLISAVGHYAGAARMSLRSILWLFIALAAAGWAAMALESRRRRRFPATATPAIAICTLAFVVAVAPLLLLGYLTTIGTTIDGLSYATRSEYLQDAPLRLPGPEAGKPWIDWVRTHIDLMRAGDVMLVGVLGAMTGRRSYELLTVVPSLFFALTAGSVFVWARASLRLGQRGALLAALLAGLSNLLLWPVYDNFLSQALGIGFLPLMLCFGIEARRRPGWGVAALLGLLLSGLVSVYPVYAIHALGMILCFWAAAWLLWPGGPRASALGRASLWWSGVLAAAFLWNGVALVRSAHEVAVVLRPKEAGERRYRLGIHVSEPSHGKHFGTWSLDFGPAQPLQRGVVEIDLGDRSSRAEIEGRPATLLTSNFDAGEGSFAGGVVWWQLDPTEQLLVEPMLWFERTGDGSVEVTNTVAAARLSIIPPP